MKEIIVNKDYDGVRVDKVVFKVLPLASKGFIYKMYRKKNIVVNKKKVTGKEALQTGDVIMFFFSDETFNKFSNDGSETAEPLDYTDEKANSKGMTQKTQKGRFQMREINALKNELILYEDEDLLVYNKESNMLSQSNGRDHHLMECYVKYMENKGENFDELSSYGVCNRLDRNTTGTILIGKNPRSLRLINNHIMEGLVEKKYHAIVLGDLRKSLNLKGYLNKKSNRNKVSITKNGEGDFIHTLVEPLKHSKDNKYTLVEVEIKTGKSHQIRAHLSSVGYPLVGDGKYGDKKSNDYFRKQFKIKYQMLHSINYTLGSIPELSNISGKSFRAPYFGEFKMLLDILFDI